MKTILILRLPAEQVIELSKLCVLHPKLMWVVCTFSRDGFMSTNVFVHVVVEKMAIEFVDNTIDEIDPRKVIQEKLGKVIIDEIKF